MAQGSTAPLVPLSKSHFFIIADVSLTSHSGQALHLHFYPGADLIKLFWRKFTHTYKKGGGLNFVSINIRLNLLLHCSRGPLKLFSVQPQSNLRTILTYSIPKIIHGAMIANLTPPVAVSHILAMFKALSVVTP